MLITHKNKTKKYVYNETVKDVLGAPVQISKYDCSLHQCKAIIQETSHLCIRITNQTMCKPSCVQATTTSAN